MKKSRWMGASRALKAHPVGSEQDIFRKKFSGTRAVGRTESLFDHE